MHTDMEQVDKWVCDSSATVHMIPDTSYSVLSKEIAEQPSLPKDDYNSLNVVFIFNAKPLNAVLSTVADVSRSDYNLFLLTVVSNRVQMFRRVCTRGDCNV